MSIKTYLIATDTNFENSKLTGAHKRLLELVKGLSINNNVIMLSFDIPQLKNNKNIKFLKITPTKLSFLPANVKRIIQISKSLNRINVNYDYAISFNPNITCAYAISRLKNVISLFRENLIDYHIVLNSSFFKIKYYSIIEKIAVKKSDLIIVQNSEDKRRLIDRNIKYCPNINEKLEIQVNNVNASWMKECTFEYIENNEIPTMIFIGNFNDIRKGHSILLPAIAKLLESGININAFIIGDGKELKQYKNKYESFKEIKFLGHVNNPYEFYLKSDFAIVPSLIDSCPNTVLEAINLGIAVYGSNTGGIPELLCDEKYMFEPDFISIFNFLYDVIKNKRYVKDAKKQVELKDVLTFNWADKIESIIKSKMVDKI